MSTTMDARGTIDSSSARPSRRRGRLGAYGLWQLRDYVKDRGIPTLIVATLSGYLGLSPILKDLPALGDPVPARVIAQLGSAEAVHAARMLQFNSMFLRSILGTLIFLGALFAMNGIVANDRKLGFYRFLFAKPVTPSRYYGQAFLVHWAGFLGVMTLLGALYGAVIWPILTRPLLVVLALMFVAYSGIAFLLSAAARWDWMSLVAVSIGANLLWARFGESTHPLAALLYLLPPLHRTDEVYAAVAAAPMAGATPSFDLPWALIAWLVGYGAVCYVAGLVVLRYRRLAII